MTRNPWVGLLFRPLVIGLMFGCVALSLVEFVRLLVPTWSGTYLIAACVLAALDANYSYRLIRARTSVSLATPKKPLLGRGEVLRFRAVELTMLFLLLKVGRYIGTPWVAVAAEIRTWPRDPFRILDLETTVAFLLVLLSWWAATQTVRDLERLGEPPGRRAFYVPPMERLSERFFWGGVVLLIAAGMTRIGIAHLLDLDRPSVPGLVLNVLVYFLLGLVMLGQVQFATLRKRWQAQEIRVADELAGRWLRYSLIFIGLAALVAFFLPTGYTFGLMDVIGFALGLMVEIISAIAALFFLILMLPLAWLLSKLMEEVPLPRARLQPLQVPQQMAGGGTTDWVEMLRSFFFWIVILGMVFYVVRSYLRDHPELLQALAMLRPFRVLRRLWAALWQQLDEWVEAVSEHLPRGWPLLRREPAQGRFRFFRLRAASPREQILYYYLSILRRAAQRGFPRRPAQTPYEYHADLEPQLPEAHLEMALLTQAFVEARYSQHPIAPEQARRVRADWQRVKAALRALVRRET